MSDQFDDTSQDTGSLYQFSPSGPGSPTTDDDSGQLYQFYDEDTMAGAKATAENAGWEADKISPPSVDPETGVANPGSFYAYPPGQQQEQPQE